MTQRSTQGAGGQADMVDLTQFHQVFFDEAGEHLAEMETLLLRLEPSEATGEELNAIFRAAHSIKGGSGTFGFTDMTGVTHELESLLDRVRKNEIPLTAEMVDVLLQAGDVLKAQLARHRGATDVPEPAAAEVCARIRELREQDSQEAAPPTPVAQAVEAPQRAQRVVEISYALPKAVKSRKAFDALLLEIDRLGTLDPVAEKDKPAAGRKKPGKRVTKAVAKPGRLRLKTTATDAEILEFFAFVLDPKSLTIVQVDEPTASTAGGAPATDDDGYGFFDPLPQAADAAPAEAAAPDPGYGFFNALPAAAEPTQPQSVGRRAIDKPEAEVARAGRRDTDKVVVAAQADAVSIRVGVEKVDQLINQVGELVITQAMLAQQVGKLDAIEYQHLLSAMGDLERNTRDLQQSVMSMRMMPIAFAFNRFPRLVRDLAAKLGKQAQLVTVGEQTELDKGLIEKISDPLTHLVRNSIDHGIELPALRTAAEKVPMGTITLKASQQGGNIVIEVSDDGRGLDRDRILEKARERGMAVSDAMSDQEVWLLIFEAGFSTADVVTDVSGRGVGMDVVKRNIRELGGNVEIESRQGAGTRFIIRLPLTLAIMDGMSLAVNGETYIIPLASVIESLQIPKGGLRPISGQGRVINVRSEYLPVASLRELFGGTANDDGILVVVEADGVKTALMVDELLGQHQIVVKNLEANYRKVPGIAAATIMGDGKVGLILDVPALVKMSRH